MHRFTLSGVLFVAALDGVVDPARRGLTAPAGARVALAVAAVGAALVTAAGWPLLRTAVAGQAVA